MEYPYEHKSDDLRVSTVLELTRSWLPASNILYWHAQSLKTGWYQRKLKLKLMEAAFHLV
jgi:hypothetical protein